MIQDAFDLCDVCVTSVCNVCFLLSQGYFLLFESMLDSVLYARDCYLADGGSGRSHKGQITSALALVEDKMRLNSAGIKGGTFIRNCSQ